MRSRIRHSETRVAIASVPRRHAWLEGGIDALIVSATMAIAHAVGLKAGLLLQGLAELAR